MSKKVRSPAFRRSPESVGDSIPPEGGTTNMYRWRDWTPAERATALAERQERGFPWHGPPHLAEAGSYRIITGTCYEHKHILTADKRLAYFENQLLSHVKNQSLDCVAWVVLPNHYHLLVKIGDIKAFTRAQGKLHGRTSFEWNREDGTVGRSVWYRCQDRVMRSEAHYHTTINYIHNNPVKHGYVEKWGDWPYSSFHWYLKEKGREWLLDLWRECPVLNYGDKWDA